MVVLWMVRLLQVQVVVVVVNHSLESEVGLEWEKRGQRVLCQKKGQSREVILGLRMRKWFDSFVQLQIWVRRYWQG